MVPTGLTDCSNIAHNHEAILISHYSLSSLLDVAWTELQNYTEYLVRNFCEVSSTRFTIFFKDEEIIHTYFGEWKDTPMGYTKSTGEPHVKPVRQLFRGGKKWFGNFGSQD
jgi:hypothetical protein